MGIRDTQEISHYVRRIYDALGVRACAMEMACTNEKEAYKYSNPNGESIPLGRLQKLIRFVGRTGNARAKGAVAGLGLSLLSPANIGVVDMRLIEKITKFEAYGEEESPAPLCTCGDPMELIPLCLTCRKGK